MRLRQKMIEAGTRAIWDEWEALPDYEALNADARANAHADIEIVLDTFLDCLVEFADETGASSRSAERQIVEVLKDPS